MELIFDFTWLLLTLALCGAAWWSVRRGVVKISMRSALTLALLVGFILLPAVSMSDDLVKSSQDGLPLSSQTYLMSFEGASVGLDLLPLAGLLMALLACLWVTAARTPLSQWHVRPLAARLARSQRLRPPPFLAY